MPAESETNGRANLFQRRWKYMFSDIQASIFSTISFYFVFYFTLVCSLLRRQFAKFHALRIQSMQQTQSAIYFHLKK